MFKRQIIGLVTLLLLLSGCSAANNQAAPTQQGFLVDFGDSNRAKLSHKVAQMSSPQSTSRLRVLQLGDSHTAADLFSGQLRERFQHQFRSAGVGGIAPMFVPGQSHAQISYRSNGWSLTSSRKSDHPDFPMGGFIATPQRKGAYITVQSKEISASQPMTISLLVKQKSAGQPLRFTSAMSGTRVLKTHSLNRWEYVEVIGSLPFTVESSQAGSAELGWVWLENQKGGGAVVTPVGVNGAVQDIWSRWSSRWVDDLRYSKADLVILSYGTNEGFNNTLDPQLVKQKLTEAVKLVRRTLPNASVLIIGAPDSLDKKRVTPSEAEKALNNRLDNQLKLVKSDVEKARLMRNFMLDRRMLRLQEEKHLQQTCRDKQPVQLTEMKAVQEQVAREQKTLYWDWMSAMGGACSIDDWYMQDLARGDFVHLNRAGYQRSADILYSELIILLRQ